MPSLRNNYYEPEEQALRTVFQYYSDNSIAGNREFIYLAECYCIIDELGQKDEERLCMKNAIEDHNLRPEEKSDIPTGCISLKDYVSILSAAPCDHIHLIRVIANYHRRCDSEGKYLLARDFLKHYQILRNSEETRQLEIIKKRQIDDRRKVIIAHDQQLVKFTQVWHQFMQEFEHKSLSYLEELDRQHQAQLLILQSEVIEEVKSKPQRWSRELVDWRKQEAKMVGQQRYQEAQKIKLASDALELSERMKLSSNVESSLKLKRANLSKQHAAEKFALCKRIETKRREFQHQQKVDFSRCSQRNKNILAMLDSKHDAECSEALRRLEKEIKNYSNSK
ncbi:hypothetical protein HJC23_005875 [Cyclotella cryptica]|uniref:Uncharacterized protein n=1 Tax=Cyclotella cryptica TaxID=29204 RepID=A0ABD3R4I6_9STRA|eukprot:CCRYP_000408-RA/>CCRYP_000408-RA protein AED:0.00 eAED:0.00 QI:2268/1/1/1/1/0.5/4/605/336